VLLHGERNIRIEAFMTQAAFLEIGLTEISLGFSEYVLQQYVELASSTKQFFLPICDISWRRSVEAN
jgi:hypothetical protein